MQAESKYMTQIIEHFTEERQELDKLCESGQSAESHRCLRVADPTEYENLFPGLKEAFVVEEYVKQSLSDLRPAREYPLVTPNEERNLLEEAKGFEPSGVMASQKKAEEPIPSPKPEVMNTVLQNPDLLPPRDQKTLLDLEDDLDNLDLEDIDTTDINLDEEILDE